MWFKRSYRGLAMNLLVPPPPTILSVVKLSIYLSTCLYILLCIYATGSWFMLLFADFHQLSQLKEVHYCIIFKITPKKKT